MVGTKFIFNARKISCPIYFTYSARAINSRSSLLYRLSDNILDALKNFDLQKFAFLTRAVTDLEALIVYLCVVLHWSNTAVWNG